MAIKEIRREWSACQLGYVCEFMLHTEADVKDLPICCVGSVAHVSETNRDFVCNGKRWLPREGETIVILPETTVTPDEERLAPITEPLLTSLVAGNEYTVTYNGAEYLCKAQNAEAYVMLGNVGADTGGVDTGEPFMFGALSPEEAAQMGFYAMLFAFDGAETVTLSITAKTELVNESENAGGAGSGGGGGVMMITAELTSSTGDLDNPDTVQNPSHTYEEVKAAVDAGKYCILATEIGGQYYYLPMTAAGDIGNGMVYGFTMSGMAISVDKSGWSKV